MAQAEDLDMTIDGFNPDVLNARGNRRHGRKSREDNEIPTYFPPQQPKAKSGTLRQAPAQQAATQQAVAAPAIEDVPSQREEESKGEKAVKSTPSGNWRDWSVVRFFTDKRTRVFLGFSLILMSVFVLIALVSHFKNGALDQSIVDNSTFAQMAANPEAVHNATGGFGAWLAKTCMCDSLGLGAAVLIVYVWLLGLGLLGYKKVNFWSLTFKCLLVGITISLVLGLVTYTWATAFKWGGMHGHYINEWIMDRASWIGATLVSALLILAVVCVYLNEIHSAWSIWKQKMETRRAAELYRKEKETKIKTTIDLDKTVQETAAVQTNETAEEQEPIAEEKADKEAEPNTGFFISEAEIESEEVNSPYSPMPMPEPMATTSESISLDSETEEAKDEKENPLGGFVLDTEEGFSVVAPAIEMADKIEESPTTAEELVKKDGLYDHRADLSRYRFPDIDLLEDRPAGPVIDFEEQQANKERIVDTLLKYNIPISKIEATVGPTVTLYEIVPGEGVRISQIKRLEDDIALSLAALGIRIIAPIPGKGTVGIEVPNKEPQTVSMRTIIASKKYQECKYNLPMAMGATISNEIFIADLTKMPHLLVAGATGMGKSVGLNAIIASMLYKKHPSELKFVLIDPKQVEFSLYSRLERHFLAKLPDAEDAIITDTKKVIETLNSLCVEMDNRYALLKAANVRVVEEYNKKFTERRLSPTDGHKYLPYIVVVVDEFADLIMTVGKEVETPIARIAQKARAVGIHMIIATQRPSTNVITGLIKANFPGRIAFRVIQMVDSRTILDSPGANQLIGRGDMLFSHNGSMERVQCAFLSTEEVEAIVQSIDDQVGYPTAYLLPDYVPEPDGQGGDIAGAGSDRDAMFEEAARFIISRNNASTSSLQRQFNIGYNRAGRLMDQMEAAGIIGPLNGAKPRAILVTMTELEYMLEQNK